MRVLVKVGGAQLEEPTARGVFARAVAGARHAGHELILVHGGGGQIRRLGERLGLEEVRVRGLRVTDEPTAEVVQWVLAGEVGKSLAASLVQCEVPAVSLCGADAGLFDAEPLDARLGYVGRIGSVRPAVVQTLLDASLVPVIATTAPLAAGASGPDARFYNINADHAVAPLAAALEAQAVLFLSDVPGVLVDGAIVPALDADQVAAHEASGVVSGGMIPKLEAALEACAARPDALVKIAPAGGDEPILAALAGKAGTRISPLLAPPPSPQAAQHG